MDGLVRRRADGFVVAQDRGALSVPIASALPKAA
jgi:hypothetical protein